MTARDTRELILDAAASVLRELGLARATTKEIARAAGYSEATLYKHFTNKEDLFVHVLQERVPPFASILFHLTERVGREPVRDTLVDVATAGIEFYVEVFPTAASLFAEPELLAAHRASLGDQGVGPQVPVTVLAEYLRAERAAGRISAEVDVEASAALLLGACFQQAFLVCFSGEPRERTAEQTTVSAEALVRALVTPMLPPGEGGEPEGADRPVRHDAAADS